MDDNGEQTKGKPKKAIPELSVEVRLLTERLRLLEPDEFISYIEMSEVVGQDIQAHRWILSSARNRILRQDGIVTGCVHGEGIKRYVDAQIHSISEAMLVSTRRRIRKTIRQLVAADYDLLSDDEKATHNTHLSILGVLHQFTKPKTIRRIEAAVGQTLEQLPLSKTIELFGQGIKATEEESDDRDPDDLRGLVPKKE